MQSADYSDDWTFDGASLPCKEPSGTLYSFFLKSVLKLYHIRVEWPGLVEGIERLESHKFARSTDPAYAQGTQDNKRLEQEKVGDRCEMQRTHLSGILHEAVAQ